MPVAVETSTNRSNAIISSDELETLLELFEDVDAWPDYFLAKKTDSTTMSITDREILLRNFPKENPLRRSIKRLAGSIPSFIWGVKKDTEEKRKKELMDMATEVSERRGWEGDVNLWTALNAWREFVLDQGDIFVKLPRPKSDGQVEPERIAAADSKILGSKTRRKKIEGFKFEYVVGLDDDGGSGRSIIEEVNAKEWITTEPGQGPSVQAHGQDFIPVAHLSWERREGMARGLPLAKELVAKILHLFGVMLDRRMGNRMNAYPILVLRNCKAGALTPRPGMVLEIDDASPAMPASAESIGGNLSLVSLENEEQDARRAVDAAAYLPYEGKEGAQGVENSSGRAMERLSGTQVLYRLGYMLAEGCFLENLIYMCLKIEGKKIERGELVPVYDGFGEDTKRTLDKADLLMANSFLRQDLRVMGFEEDEVEKLIKERGEDKEKVEDMFGAGPGRKVEDEDPEAKAKAEAEAAKKKAEEAAAEE